MTFNTQIVNGLALGIHYSDDVVDVDGDEHFGVVVYFACFVFLFTWPHK